MSKIKSISIGSDPEYAVFDKNGIPRSIVGFLPGTKQEPYKLKDDWSCQIDNVGAEMCIPVCFDKESFIHAMMHGKQLVEKKVQEQQPDWALRSVSSARYSMQELDSYTAQQFGCEPSYCVYTGTISPRPTPQQVGDLRSFGFHIHIGYKTDGDDVIECFERIIKAMDITCGLGSILIDSDEDRRSIYGNAGDFRFRQVGDVNIIEYRTLGGAMHLDEELVGWVYDQTMQAINMVNNWKDEYDEMGNDVENAINTGNVEDCINLMNHFKVNVPETYERILETV